MVSSILESQSQKHIIDYKYRGVTVSFIDLEAILLKSYKKYVIFLNNIDVTHEKTAKNYKKLLLHNIISNIFIDLEPIPLENRVILYFSRETTQFLDFFKEISKILHNIPVRYMVFNQKIEDFINGIQQNSVENIVLLEKTLHKPKSSLNKFLKYLKSNGLDYLCNVYLKQATNKMVIVR